MEGRPLDDAELTELARRGDARAYEELVTRYSGIAHRTAYFVTGSAPSADDAVQEAFVKAYYALGGFRRGSSFKPWLLKIVANEARNQMRSAGRRAGLELRLAETRPSGDAAPSPEVAAVTEDRRRRLLEELRAMKERDRLVIACRYFLELDEGEMAAVLGVARGTVKSRLSRALARLRQRLGDEWMEDEMTVRGGGA